MRINLNQLHSFYISAKQKSITKAAKELFISQPAVSTQIKSLENSLGLQLIVKRSNAFRLTDSGETLFNYANRIFDLVDEMENSLRKFEELTEGSITIGITRSFAKKLMPTLLARFQKQFPQLKILLKVGSSKEIAERILDYKYDLGIVGKFKYPPKIKWKSFSKEEFCLVVAPDHKFAKQESVSFEDLKQELFIIREKGSSSREAILTLLQEHHIDPKVIIEAESVEFIKEYIIRGQGISILYAPEVDLETKMKLLKQIPLKEGTVYLETDVIFRDDSELPPPTQAFLRIIKEERDQLLFRTSRAPVKT
ncbi:MAG: LysR family transcriptional regulator [SAR324 cluster bacterium]|nr:LysR family transcriptional regulator [SAR324 cluster bacterium]